MTSGNSLKLLKLRDAKIKEPKEFRGKLSVSLIEPKLSVPRLSNIHIHNILRIFQSAAGFFLPEGQNW